MNDKNLIPMFKTKYVDHIREDLAKTFNLNNPLSIPKLLKIVVNVGAGSEIPIKKAIEVLEAICAQKAVVKKARLSVAAFKIREGSEIGACVTCRKDSMYYTLQRLFLALLNWRNFKLLNVNSINCLGNSCQITIGIKDVYSIFQGLQMGSDSIKTIGCSFTIVSNAKTKDQFVSLLKGFGFPFQKEGGDLNANER